VFVDGQLVAYADDFALSVGSPSMLTCASFLVLRLLIEKMIGLTLSFTVSVWIKVPITV
jgi:hypothetical protein